MAAINKNDVVAFSMPGGEVSAVAKAKTRPIDLAHLSRQTMGDRELEREVLDLFVDQAQGRVLNERTTIGCVSHRTPRFGLRTLPLLRIVHRGVEHFPRSCYQVVEHHRLW